MNILVNKNNYFQNCFLSEEQIGILSNAYHNYEDVDGLASIRVIREIEENDYSLAIPLYVKSSQSKDFTGDTNDIYSWNDASFKVHGALEEFCETIKQVVDEKS